MLERRPDGAPGTTPATTAAGRSGPAPAARAAISPSAIVLAGGGLGLSLVAGLPVAAAIGVAACGWAIGAGVAGLIGARRRRRAARPEPIDPYAVPDPWRDFVREAQGARTKFVEVVAQYRPGPLRQRLDEVAARVDDAVRECWRVAHLGAALDVATSNLDPAGTSSELRGVQDERQRLLAASPAASTTSLDDTEASLAARLQSGRRVEAARQRALDRLRMATAQLNEAVASAAELSLEATDAGAAEPVAGHVDSVVAEIESLRRGLEEAETAPAPRSIPPS
jgi:hypothetical protein